MSDVYLQNKTLLIVDDEPDLRGILSSELEYLGAKVYQAENVTAAKLIIDQHNIDLVISDIRMPGETGIDLLSYIKSKSNDGPPVILITGFADITNQSAMEKGAAALLSKPFLLEDLFQMANNLTIHH
jgi:DNA-binding NtrC family response regulator